MLAGGPFDGVGCLLERSSGRLDRSEAAQAVRVTFGGQVERPVGGMKIRVAAMAVGETLHLDRPQDRHQRSPMATLDGAVSDSLGVEDRFQPALGRGPQPQMVLQHPPQQLPATTVELVLKLGVGETSRFGPLKPSDGLLETPP